MPMIAPTPPRMIDENENVEPPHKSGTIPPSVEPTAAPSHINDFDSIETVYLKKNAAIKALCKESQ